MDLITSVRKLFGSYPQMAVPDETIAVYLERLSKYDADLVAVAVNECIEECERLPSIARIIKGVRRQEWDRYMELVTQESIESAAEWRAAYLAERKLLGEE